jgi:hypothetical protein
VKILFGMCANRDLRRFPLGILDGMTRITSVLAVCALAAIGVASAAPSEPAGKPAQLHVASTSPLVVHGVGFKSRERVRLRVTTAAESQSQTKVATRAGAVKVKFAMWLRSCGPASARMQAIGSRGSRASALANVTIEVAYPRRPQPDCAPFPDQ